MKAERKYRHATTAFQPGVPGRTHPVIDKLTHASGSSSSKQVKVILLECLKKIANFMALAHALVPAIHGPYQNHPRTGTQSTAVSE